MTVRSDWHRRGVGYLLLSALIEVARETQVEELFGLVLREHRPMLDICRDLGFTVAEGPSDVTVSRVRKSLAAAGEARR